MSVMSDIRAALESEIANVTGIPSAQYRAWENVKFKPDENQTWVRMQISPLSQRPAVRGPDPQLRHDGLFLVDVFVPDKIGPNSADVLADAIRDHFTVDDVYTSNTVNVRFRYSERRAGIQDGPWYMVPVTIAWYTYHK